MKKLFILILLSVNLFSWEINTHRAIDREALKNTENLKAFTSSVELFDDYKSEMFEDYGMTYTYYIMYGEGNGISALGQKFPETIDYKSLLEAGAMLEDAQWPHPDWWPNKADQAHGRFLNHFYNPQSHWPSGNDARIWALMGSGNQYSYIDAMKYFAKGFSEPDINERRRYQAKMFVSVGQMMHMTNDMNVPAHVRGDLHPLYEPLELWMKGGEDHNQNTGYYIKGNAPAGSLSPSAGIATTHKNFMQYMTSEAIYTSNNFFSKDTIFTQPYPAKTDTYEDKSIWLTPTVEKVYIKHNSDNRKLAIRVKSYIINVLNELYESDENDTIQLDKTPMFDGDFTVLKENGEILIPRAIGNASGFVNYFFRGRLDAEFTACGLYVENVSNPALVADPSVVTFKSGGHFNIYADKPDGTRVHIMEYPLGDDLFVKQKVRIVGFGQKLIDAGFPDDDPTLAITIMFDGDIGAEKGVAVVKKDGVVPTPFNNKTAGAVEVTLSWDNGADYDLELDMPGSVHDVESCNMEHAYVKSEFSIYPGRYPVNVTKESTDKVSGTYYVSIVTPGESKVIKVDANTTGHLADIVVAYVNNKPVVTLQTGVSKVIFSNGGGVSGGIRPIGYPRVHSGINSGEAVVNTTCGLSCGCNPCEYWVVPYLGQAMTGPLSGADIALYRLEDFRTNSAKYEGKTSTGDTLITAGLLNIPAETIVDLNDSELYIITVSGGMDIDADDNMVVDSFPTQNLGTLHAIISGSELKMITPKVNILTEVAYQIVKEDIANATKTNEEILATLDDIALRLLNAKIYPESEGDLSHVDLLEWLPTWDQSLLYANYQKRVVPIVQHLLLGMNIYEDAYNLVYFPDGILPVLQSKVFYAQEDMSVNTIVGTIPVQHEGNSSIESMQLYGAYADVFTIDDNGVIRLQQPLDYETVQQYYLEVTATNSAGESKKTAIYIVVRDVKDAPLFTGYTAATVYSSSEAGTYVGKLEIDEGISPITSVRLTGEDSNYFQISMDGNISVNQTLKNYFLAKEYNFQAIATNDSGDSQPATITVNISDGGEIPLLKSLDINVAENSPGGTIIAQAEFVRQGKSEVDAYYLYGSDGEDSSIFSITTQGEIVVAQGAIIDFEKKDSYDRWLSVHNSFGNSPTVKVTIHVIDLLVEPPVTNSTRLDIPENSKSGTPVGQLQFNKGSVQEVSIELSGPGSENFTVENDKGLVTVAPSADLDFERVTYYDLDYKVTNAVGSSSNKLYISVVDVPDVAAVLHDATFTQYYHEFVVGNIIANVLSKIGDTPIKIITLSPDSPFGIKLNGDIYIKRALDTDKTNYTLTAIAADSYSTSNASTIEIKVISQPYLVGTTLSVAENAPFGTLVGTIDVLSTGLSSIDSFTLSDNTNFIIDNNGTVRVAMAAQLDYEKRRIYNLTVHAENEYGQSNEVPLEICLVNVPEVAPLLRDVNATYYTGVRTNTDLGNVIVDHGDTPISVLTLSPTSPFTVDFNGSIRLADTLPTSSASEFNLTAEATNGFGKSNQAHVNISVCTHASECMEYVRQLYMPLQQVALGPIAGGTFSLQQFGVESSSIIYEGVTSSGELLIENGIITFPQTIRESVSSDDLFTVSVTEGDDLDANDDFTFDEIPQENLGTIHAIIGGNHVQGDSFKVNVLTEIVYQAVHKVIDENATKDELVAMLDNVSKRLIKSDLTEDGIVSYEDVTSWMAGFDKDKLLFDYDEKIEPIVQKIYKNEDIYLNVYKLLYTGTVDSISVDVSGTGSIVRIKPNLFVDLSVLQKEDIVVKDAAGNVIDFTFEIIDGELMIYPAVTLNDGEVYTAEFSFVVTDGTGNSYLDTQLQTFSLPDTTPPVVAESTIHIAENIVYWTSQLATDASTPLTYTIVGGEDSGLFKIVSGYSLGDALQFTEIPNYERPVDSNGDNVYEVDISIADSAANMTTQSIRIIVDDVVEGAELADTNLTVDENAPVGTYVGSVNVVNEGDGNLTEFFLYDNEQPFSINVSGEIFTKAVFDFEKAPVHLFDIGARNSTGTYANRVTVQVDVNDINEWVPTVHHFTGSMDEHAPTGKVVGQLYVYPGLDANVSIRLVGDGADDFDINASGHVTVSATADLDHTARKHYDLKAIANNGYGDSDEANVTIYINTWSRQFGTELDDKGSLVGTDGANNVYLGGTMENFFLRKYDRDGVLLWTREYPEILKVNAVSMAIDANGTIYLAGTQGTDYRDVAWIAAFTSDGELLWSTTIDSGTYSSDAFKKVIVNTDGDVIAAGNTSGAFTGYVNSGGYDLFVAKLSAQGETRWLTQFGSSSYDYAKDIAFNADGELYLLASQGSNTLTKFDQSSGDIIWSKESVYWVDGTGTYYEELAIDSANNIYILALQEESWDQEDGSYHYDLNVGVVKVNVDGVLVWSKVYGTDEYETPTEIAVNSNDEIYVTGDAFGDLYDNYLKIPYSPDVANYDKTDLFVMQIDGNGNMLQTRLYGSLKKDGMNDMCIDTDRNILLTGYVSDVLDGNTALGKKDGFLMKVPY